MQIIIYILILIFLVSPAISNNLNYSKEYTIEFSSKNIKLKKEETINLIKKQSFKKIINSYLTSDSYNNIIKNINIDLINTFIYGIEIYEEKINNLQSFPYYGIVGDEAIYFFKDIPINEQEWEENREGEALQNDWVPVLQGEKKTGEGSWVSVLYMDPETGETEVFWTLKRGFAAFSLYPLLDRTVEDFV